MNRLRQLGAMGQAVWMDYIRRDLLLDGGLKRLVEEDGITGMTSNPAIFEKAILSSEIYDDEVGEVLAEDPGASVQAIYERLAVTDIRLAADILLPVFERTDGADGFVSLEVSPRLAADTPGTLAEARSLWERVDRPNLMIKVPATSEGIPAIEELIAAGIHVNATLMFSLAHYDAVSGAYLRGLARLDDPSRVASVASFFVSRVDSMVDAKLSEIGGAAAEALLGTVAIDNSKMAYRCFRERFHGAEFAALRSAGARPQRVLWASTSTKNPAYRDVLYVEDLIGDETVNTVPPATLEAFRDHGEVRPTLVEDWDGADGRLASLAALGIDLDAVTETLQQQGVSKFVEPFDRLLAALDEKRLAVLATLDSVS